MAFDRQSKHLFVNGLQKVGGVQLLKRLARGQRVKERGRWWLSDLPRRIGASAEGALSGNLYQYFLRHRLDLIHLGFSYSAAQRSM
jgi:hypothetical protein